MEDINKTTSGDYAYAIVKGTLGMVPIGGSLASELLSLLVTPPLEKRRQAWMQQVGEQLIELKDREALDLESLFSNDHFVDIVAQASTLAIKTSEAEKVAAFKNAIINTALGNEPDNTISSIFLNFIDSFTSWHIIILHFFDNPVRWYQNQNRSMPEFAGGLRSLLVDAYPDLKSQSAIVDLIWADLGRSGFQNSSELGGMMSSEGLKASRTTELGKRFLRFISDYNTK